MCEGDLKETVKLIMLDIYANQIEMTKINCTHKIEIN